MNNKEFFQADLTDEQFEANREFAESLYVLGIEKPRYSAGICGSTTAGYGQLDKYGYFEYPLIVDQDTYEIILEK